VAKDRDMRTIHSRIVVEYAPPFQYLRASLWFRGFFRLIKGLQAAVHPK